MQHDPLIQRRPQHVIDRFKTSLFEQIQNVLPGVIWSFLRFRNQAGHMAERFVSFEVVGNPHQANIRGVIGRQYHEIVVH